ncbi:non-LTR retrotransposon transposase [Trifolium pratense]|uniref:Non-LTR retrotransposon transposase n=1 Tax=Trifolium pratense TaxID=57577 RepID=A0A2K3LL45_TRIPR|nr:non-LTR retrotransposon transposase [Trifolium pratense]
MRKEYGGLGVRQLREFNLALLGKWCWRLLVDRGGLWFIVLAARYGLKGGRVKAGDPRWSSWWREIVRIRDGVRGSAGGWFGESVLKKGVGMGGVGVEEAVEGMRGGDVGAVSDLTWCHFAGSAF